MVFVIHVQDIYRQYLTSLRTQTNISLALNGSITHGTWQDEAIVNCQLILNDVHTQ